MAIFHILRPNEQKDHTQKRQSVNVQQTCEAKWVREKVTEREDKRTQEKRTEGRERGDRIASLLPVL